MSNPSLASVLALLRAHARIEEQFGHSLGSVHGLAAEGAVAPDASRRGAEDAAEPHRPRPAPACQRLDGDAHDRAAGEARHGRQAGRRTRCAARLCRADAGRPEARHQRSRHARAHGGRSVQGPLEQAGNRHPGRATRPALPPAYQGDLA